MSHGSAHHLNLIIRHIKDSALVHLIETPSPMSKLGLLSTMLRKAGSDVTPLFISSVGQPITEVVRQVMRLLHL